LPGIWNCSIPAYEDDRSVGGDGDIHDVVRTVAAPGAFGVVAEIEERPTGVGDFLVAPSNADIVVLPTAASEVQHNEVLAGVSGKSGDTIRIIQMRYVMSPEASRLRSPRRMSSIRRLQQPKLEEQRYVLQALQPHRPPAFADKYWIGRKAH
jgi:hypothetical protein